MTAMKKTIFIIGFLLLAVSVAFSQEMVVMEGSQKLGSNPKNSEMLSDPVTLTQTMTITKVEGDFSSFWLTGKSENGENITEQYMDRNTPVGKVLNPGIYFVFPNLKQGSSTAKVTVYLTTQ